jgi:hypothetical protein
LGSGEGLAREEGEDQEGGFHFIFSLVKQWRRERKGESDGEHCGCDHEGDLLSALGRGRRARAIVGAGRRAPNLSPSEDQRDRGDRDEDGLIGLEGRELAKPRPGDPRRTSARGATQQTDARRAAPAAAPSAMELEREASSEGGFSMFMATA